MKNLLVLGLAILYSLAVKAQNITLNEKAYLDVINAGPSTGPNFVVITIHNTKTGTSKEICISVNSLFLAIDKEYFLGNGTKNYLLSRSSSRTFALKTDKALDLLNYNNYSLKNKEEIAATITAKHLTDSLQKLVEFRRILSIAYNYYSKARKDILQKIGDSIKTTRTLTEEETKILSDLEDPYYDDYYTKSDYRSYSKISPKGTFLMKIWLKKIYPFRKKIETLENNSKRMYDKFFQKYYNKWGINFCHVGFKFGIITNMGDEVAVVGFDAVVKTL